MLHPMGHLGAAKDKVDTYDHQPTLPGLVNNQITSASV